MGEAIKTKQKLAVALKNLAETMKFEKITVADICEQCDINRKSFYYHFRDKYDLMNWLFDTEIIILMDKMENNGLKMQEYRLEDYKNWLTLLVRYFYANKAFYKTVLQVEGQNSFSKHFREFLQPIFWIRMKQILCNDDVGNVPKRYMDFAVENFSDAFIGGLQRWIFSDNPVSPDEYVDMFMFYLRTISKGLSGEFSEFEK